VMELENVAVALGQEFDNAKRRRGTPRTGYNTAETESDAATEYGSELQEYCESDSGVSTLNGRGVCHEPRVPSSRRRAEYGDNKCHGDTESGCNCQIHVDVPDLNDMQLDLQ
jgi:hypothetical protein